MRRRGSFGDQPGSLKSPSIPKGILITTAFMRRTTAIALFIGTAALAACASTAHTEGTGEYVDDTVITPKVKTAVPNAPSLKSAEIKVEAFKGEVQLSGFVKSQADIDQATALARNVEGVKSVANDMQLK